MSLPAENPLTSHSSVRKLLFCCDLASCLAAHWAPHLTAECWLLPSLLQAKSPPPPQSGKKPTGIIVTDELPRPVSTTSPMVAVVAVAVIGLSALAAYVYRREVWSWVGRMTSRFDAHDEQELVALKGGPEMGKDTLKISAASSSKV